MNKKKINKRDQERLSNEVQQFCFDYMNQHFKNPTNEEVEDFMEAKLKDWGVEYDYGAGERMMALLWMKGHGGFLESFKSLARK